MQDQLNAHGLDEQLIIVNIQVDPGMVDHHVHLVLTERFTPGTHALHHTSRITIRRENRQHNAHDRCRHRIIQFVRRLIRKEHHMVAMLNKNGAEQRHDPLNAAIKHAIVEHADDLHLMRRRLHGGQTPHGIDKLRQFLLAHLRAEQHFQHRIDRPVFRIDGKSLLALRCPNLRIGILRVREYNLPDSVQGFLVVLLLPELLQPLLKELVNLILLGKSAYFAERKVLLNSGDTCSLTIQITDFHQRCVAAGKHQGSEAAQEILSHGNPLMRGVLITFFDHLSPEQLSAQIPAELTPHKACFHQRALFC